MTQVKEMTNPELNRALAELMGYEVKEGHIGYLPTILVPRECSEEMHVWRYFEPCTDPGASLEVQTAAIAKDAAAYFMHIFKIKGVQFSSNHMDGYMAIATATPERGQRQHI